MSTTSDAYGTTIQGSGPDAGVFRYQANLSRLASTFTFTERQANALGESAREAETLARTEREAMQRSQATALSRALAFQESYERSQQQIGRDEHVRTAARPATQLQTLNSVARDVNRRLGLSEDSTVGKSVAAAASAGAKIPIDRDRRRRPGPKDERRSAATSQSAYDFARKAVESAQLTEASALIKDFRSSRPTSGRAGRTTSTAGYDSSSREASERQTSSDNAYGRARELARTAQFMREWSSGTQTDFTNYAARRLAERGPCEEDPIKLQRAVTEIATPTPAAAVRQTGYVPSDNPLGPSRPLPETMGWPESSLREQYDANRRAADGGAPPTDLGQ